jgi:hypothetical protein
VGASLVPPGARACKCATAVGGVKAVPHWLSFPLGRANEPNEDRQYVAPPRHHQVTRQNCTPGAKEVLVERQPSEIELGTL